MEACPDRNLGKLSPALPALERPWAGALRGSPLLWEIARAVGGGPFHVIHPDTFAENLAAFREAFDAEGVAGVVYYGKKANKAAAWLRECVVPGSGVDVASVPELAQALGNGVRGEAISVTGAAKSDGLLWLAARHRCLVAVDAPDELERLAPIAADAGSGPVDVLLRVRPPFAMDSRFGMPEDEIPALLRRCSELSDAVSVRGFSFHLDGYDPEPRAELAVRLVDLCRGARESGHRATKISIGGGFAVAYVAESDWARFEAGRGDHWFHAGRNPARTYPYHQAPTGAAMLSAILRHQAGGPTLASLLNEAGVELLVEPGRAMVEGAGCTVFPVQGFKPGYGDHGMTTVAGLSMSMSEQWKGSEFLPDPVLVRRNPDQTGGSPVRTAIAGASCMEYDVLTWRAVELAARPRPGDLIWYPNTAGYQMDKNESSFHQLPLPPKAVLRHIPEIGTWTWSADSEYPVQEIR